MISTIDDFINVCLNTDEYVGDLEFENDFDFKSLIKFLKSKEEADYIYMLGVCYNFEYGLALNEKKAYSYYKQAAEAGSARAQLMIGNSIVVEYDETKIKEAEYEASKWYLKAAKQGLALAQIELAVCLLHNNEILDLCNDINIENDEEFEYNTSNKTSESEIDERRAEAYAFYWYKQAAKQNNPTGMMKLAEEYENGIIVDKNYDKSLFWYKKLASSNSEYSANAKYHLGQFYEFGNGINKDMIVAINWYKESAKDGNFNAILRIAQLYFYNNLEIDSNTVIKYLRSLNNVFNKKIIYELALLFYDGKLKLNDINIEQISGNSEFIKFCSNIIINDDNNIDYKNAYMLFLKAAEGNYVNAMYYLGLMYYDGLGIDKDYNKALEYFLKAANLNDEEAMFKLFEIYNKDNKDESLKWFNKLLYTKNDKLLYEIAYCYENGKYIDKDIDLAFKYYDLSANLNNYKAMYKLAIEYFNGNIIQKNYKKAYDYFMILANINYNDSKLYYAICLYNAYGCNNDYDKAYKLFDELKEEYVEAKYHLGLCLYYGQGSKKAKFRGKSLIKQAAKLGSVDAIRFLKR